MRYTINGDGPPLHSEKEDWTMIPLWQHQSSFRILTEHSDD